MNKSRPQETGIRKLYHKYKRLENKLVSKKKKGHSNIICFVLLILSQDKKNPTTQDKEIKKT